jgi:hypothetical protein
VKLRKSDAKGRKSGAEGRTHGAKGSTNDTKGRKSDVKGRKSGAVVPPFSADLPPSGVKGRKSGADVLPFSADLPPFSAVVLPSGAELRPFGAELRNFDERGHLADAKKSAITAKKQPAEPRFPAKNTTRRTKPRKTRPTGNKQNTIFPIKRRAAPSMRRNTPAKQQKPIPV